MDNTILIQGSFTADGNAKNIVLPAGVDWMRVVNLTEADAANNGHGFEFYWQRGMTDGRGLLYYHPAADQTVAVDQIAAGGGFFLVDTSNTAPSAAVAVTGTTNATQPVVATGSTAGLSDGDIVRLSSVTAAQTLGGWDFSIDTLVANTSFRMAYAMANAPGAAGTAGFWRRIPYDPIFYPRWRYIVNISQAANAVITTSVPHGYTVGQKIRVNLADDSYSMTEINGLEATVTAVTASTITTNINSTAFTAFTFPLPASYPATFATVVPVGMDTGTALLGAVDLLADAVTNTSYVGMRLVAGTVNPAGSNNDEIYWIAGKSFSNLAE